MKHKLLKVVCLALCLFSLLTIVLSCAPNNDGVYGKESNNLIDIGETSDVVEPEESVLETDENGYVKDTIDRKLEDTK